MMKDRDEKFITLRLKVCIGRLRVSPMCLFFGSLGLLQSVHVKFSRSCQNTISFQKFVITQLMHFLPGRSVRGKALDEEGHGDDEADAHEEDSVPVGLQKDKG